MNIAEIKSRLSEIVRPYIPRNAKGYEFGFIDNKPAQNMLGFAVDPKPFTGKIVAYEEGGMIIKEGRLNRFRIVDMSLATQCPPVGTQVEVIPYARRGFDGLRIDEPKPQTREVLPSGVVVTSTTMILGGSSVLLPLPEPQCYELRELKNQLEALPAPDGHRRIVHMLVDANAREFSMCDPKPDDILKTPPTIYCTVETQKFAGELAIIYDRGMDTYVINFDGRSNDEGGKEIKERIDNVYFDELGQRIFDLIDDGAWQKITVNVIALSKSKVH